MQFRVMFSRFPYGGMENAECTDWLVETVIKAKKDKRISEVLHYKIADTPITMGRNKAIKVAKENDVDLLLMVDSDIYPDLPIPGAKPFWDTTIKFMLQHDGPCVVGAPYCGPPPHENVYIFRFANHQSNNPNVDFRLEQYSREDAAARGGFEEVAALPTGLILIDMRAIDHLKPPYFEYEWEDEPYRTKKATTEDVYFTRNLSLAGVPCYVNWDAWCGHLKTKLVTKPTLLTVDHIREEYRDAIQRNRRSNERLIMVGEGRRRRLNNETHNGVVPCESSPC